MTNGPAAMMLTYLQSPAVLTLLRVAGAGMGFIAHLMLAWILPAEQLGVFFAASSLVTVGTLLTTQGYPQVATRFIVRYGHSHQRQRLRRFIARIMSDGLYAASAMALIVTMAAWAWPSIASSTRWTFTICAGIIVIATVLSLDSSIAAAKKRFALSYIPDGLVRPTLTAMAMCTLVLSGAKPDSADIALVFALICLVVTVAVHRRVRTGLPHWRFQPVKGDRLAGRWRRAARPLVLLSLFTNHFADLAILGAATVLSSVDVAIFGLCMKLAMLVGFVVQVSQQVQAPDIAEALSRRARASIEPALRRAIMLPVAVTAASIAGTLLIGDRVLAIFGPTFPAGQATLVILLAGQLIRAVAGPSTQVLTLRGAQDLNAAICVAAVIVMAIGAVLLVPSFGLLGAGTATLIALLVWVFSAAIALHKIGEGRVDGFALLKPRAAIVPRAAV